MHFHYHLWALYKIKEGRPYAFPYIFSLFPCIFSKKNFSYHPDFGAPQNVYLWSAGGQLPPLPPPLPPRHCMRW